MFYCLGLDTSLDQRPHAYEFMLLRCGFRSESYASRISAATHPEYTTFSIHKEYVANVAVIRGSFLNNHTSTERSDQEVLRPACMFGGARQRDHPAHSKMTSCRDNFSNNNGRRQFQFGVQYVDPRIASHGSDVGANLRQSGRERERRGEAMDEPPELAAARAWLCTVVQRRNFYRNIKESKHQKGKGKGT